MFLFQIIQQLAAAADHLDQSATAMMVFKMDFEMRGQRIDTRSQQGSLDFRRAGIVRAARKFRDQGGFFQNAYFEQSQCLNRLQQASSFLENRRSRKKGRAVICTGYTSMSLAHRRFVLDTRASDEGFDEGIGNMMKNRPDYHFKQTAGKFIMQCKFNLAGIFAQRR